MTSRTWATWIAATSLNTRRTSARSSAVITPWTDWAGTTSVSPGSDSITRSKAAVTESECGRRAGRPAGAWGRAAGAAGAGGAAAAGDFADGAVAGDA